MTFETFPLLDSVDQKKKSALSRDSQTQHQGA